MTEPIRWEFLSLAQAGPYTPQAGVNTYHLAVSYYSPAMQATQVLIEPNRAFPFDPFDFLVVYLGMMCWELASVQAGLAAQQNSFVIDMHSRLAWFKRPIEPNRPVRDVDLTAAIAQAVSQYPGYQ